MDIYLPGLGEGVDFHGDRTPPQLVDRRNQRVLELTALEADLVLLYSGERDPKHLFERAKAQGIAAEPSLVAAFLSRLAKAGFIPPLEVDGLLPQTKAPLNLRDRLPPFRSDLQIRPSPTSRGLVEVVDEGNRRSFTIYDFEASVARMLDGRRTAEEVIDLGAGIGIPISLASLESFLRQMGAYGFLAPIPSTDPPASTAPPGPSRLPWSPEVRALFQGALRLSRAGKAQEALDYLEALFETDPQHVEALALKQRILNAGSFPVDLNFDDLHEQADALPSRANPPVATSLPVAPAPTVAPVSAGGPAPAEVAPAPAPTPESPSNAAPAPAEAPPVDLASPMASSASQASVPEVAAPPALEALPGAVVQQPTVAAPPGLDGVPPPTARPPSRSTRRVPFEVESPPIILPWWRRWPGLVLGLAVAGAAAALWPSRFMVVVPCQLEPVTVATIVAPREGEIQARLVGAGELAKAAQPLARYQTHDLDRQLAKAEENAAAIQVQIAQIQTLVDPAAIAKLTHQVETRKAAVEKAAAKEAKLKSARPSAKRDQKLEAAAHKTEVATARLRETEAKLLAARGEDQLPALRDQVAKVVAEEKRIQANIASAVILSGAAGLFLPGPDPEGEHFAAGQDFGRIVAPDVMHLTASPPPVARSADLAHAVLTMPAGRTGTLHGLAWQAGSPGQLEATVDDAAPAQGPVIGATLQFDLGMRPRIWRLFNE